LELLVRGWAGLTMRGGGVGAVESFSIYVEDGVIVAAGSDEEVMRVASKSDHYFDVRDKGLIMPGLIDAHMHTQLAIARGFCQDVPEIEWMRKTVSPIMKHVDKNHVLAGSLLAVLEALKTGTTTLGDYGHRMSFLAREIYAKYGLRAVLTETINSLDSSLSDIKEDELYPFDIERGYGEFDAAKKLYNDFHKPPRINVMLGPQALDMVPLNLLKEITEFARENNVMIHMHVAQGGRERRQIIKRYGNSTVKILHKEKILGPNLLAAHCHDASDEELKIMAKNNVKMVSCQRSIALIDGIVPPLAKYLLLGGLSALGTDQAAGNNNQSLFTELKFVCFLNKVLMKDPTAIPAWKVLRLATIEGAMAVGLDDYLGSLEEGKRGDFIVVDLKHLNLNPVLTRPVRNYIFNLVYSSFGNEVSHVFVDGEPKVVDGKVTFVDEDSVVDKANEMALDLMDKAAGEYIDIDSMMVKYLWRGLI